MKHRIANDQIDIYNCPTISEDWKQKKLGDTYDFLKKVYTAVAFRSQEQGFNRYGFKVIIRDAHKHFTTEDFFQRNIERAMQAIESFDPDRGVTLEQYLRIDLRRNDMSLELYDAPIKPSEHAFKRLSKVRKQSEDKATQKVLWVEDGGDPRDFDVLDLANWARINNSMFEDWDGGEIGFTPVEPTSDQDVEAEVEDMIDAEKIGMFMSTLSDQERLMYLYAKENKPHQQIADELDLGCDRKTVGRRVRKIEERMRTFVLGENDTGGDENGN